MTTVRDLFTDPDERRALAVDSIRVAIINVVSALVLVALWKATGQSFFRKASPVD